MTESDLLRQSTHLMSLVVQNPGRLHRSAFQDALQKAAEENAAKMANRSGSSSNLAKSSSASASASASPLLARKSAGLSRTNSLRRSIKEVKLRSVCREGGNSRPASYVV